MTPRRAAGPPTVLVLPLDAGAIRVEVRGFTADASLLLAVDDATLARVGSEALFHAAPGLTDVMGTSITAERGDRDPIDTPVDRSNALVLLAGPGLEPPPVLDAVAAAAWLLADPSRVEPDRWFLGSWEHAGQLHRTVWDHLRPAAGTQVQPDALSAALQFVLETQPGMPADLIEANGMLSLMTAGVGLAPLAQLAGVLEGIDVRSEMLHEDGPLGFSMGSGSAEWDCLADVVDSDWLVVYAKLPLMFSGPDLVRAPSLVGRINARLQVGCLLVDESDGTTMYRAASDLGPTGQTTSIRRLLERVHSDVIACLAELDGAPATGTG